MPPHEPVSTFGGPENVLPADRLRKIDPQVEATRGRMGSAPDPDPEPEPVVVTSSVAEELPAKSEKKESKESKKIEAT